MVLQRSQPIRIWGKAVPGQQIEISFAGEKNSQMVRQDSTWMISFNPQTTNHQPQTISISSGHEKLLLQNVLIGDLWLCLGQSNMEWPMNQEMHFQEQFFTAQQPLLRFYNPTYAGKDIFGKQFSDSVLQRLNPKDFFQGSWSVSDSNSFRNMSAVGYYFGKKIVDDTGVPVGLINLAIGGAPIEAFIRREAMQQHSQFADKAIGDWLTNNALPVWIRERGAQNVGEISNAAADEFGKNHGYQPGFPYSAGIAPILDLPVKGILWYQGESNAQEKERVEEYGELMKLMVDDYRKQWKQPSMPFYFVQLSSIDTVQYKGQLWPQFRDEQRKALQKIKNTGMAVSSDAGAKADVHPRNKKIIGERLARWALKNEYGKKILPSGPLPVNAKFEKDKVFVHFDYTGNYLKTADDKAVRGFSLDGISEAEAKIQGRVIVIPVKRKPSHIYYGWKPYTDANLVNEDNLPASTFKMDLK